MARSPTLHIRSCKALERIIRGDIVLVEVQDHDIGTYMYSRKLELSSSIDVAIAVELNVSCVS